MSNNLFRNVIFSSDKYKEQLNYWKQNLTGEIKPVQLPYDHKRIGLKTVRTDCIPIQLPEEVVDRILSLCKRSDLNIYIALLAAFNSFLYKYTGEDDLLVGSPLFNASIDNYNTLVAIRNTVNQDLTFKEVLIRTKKVTMDGYKNQDYPIDMIFNELGLDCNISDLINVLFAYKNIHNDLNSVESSHDLFFVWNREEDLLNGEVVFNSNRLSKTCVQKIVNYYVKSLEYFIHNINQKVSDLEKLFTKERENVLECFNHQSLKQFTGQTIHELFEDQVKKTPDRLAVVFDNQAFTYKELNEKANQLARYLRSNQVKEDQVVAIMVERSLDMLTSIWGVIKSGAAYMPIDPDYPKERIEFMLKDSGATTLITQQHLVEHVAFADEIINLQDNGIWRLDNSDLECINNANHLTYIIYTSGSTGKPKGVMIENHSLINLVYGLKEVIYERYSENLHVSMLSPYVFDASVKQIFPALLLGHTLFVVPEEVRLNQVKLMQYFTQYQIHVVDGTPTLLKTILGLDQSDFRDLAIKQFVIGGEELSLDFAKGLLEKFDQIKPLITNVYGPTECCDVTTTYTINYEKLTELADIPIGAPLTNVRTYILNKNHELAPVGLPGELFIAGEGVSRGYLNQPDLTKERFIADPFMLGEKMYKTGDLARWLPDGNIEFLGRIDNQVKVRGYRIELGEIENRLGSHAHVQEAVVIAREDEQGNKDLCAYIVIDQQSMQEELTVVELRDYLSEELPDYMVPSFFVELDKLPLTPNGKVDRKALPDPDGMMATGAEYEAPRNEIEDKLVEIWKAILGIEKIGINDSFFDLGGHSLKATRLIAKIYKELKVEIPLRVIFKSPTIKGLSTYLHDTEKVTYSEIQPINEQEYYQVSSAQKRVFAIQQFDKQSISYNMPGVLEIDGELDRNRLEEAFQKLIERHESLRTSFDQVNEKPVQKIIKETEFRMEYREIAEEIETLAQEEIQEKIERVVKEFVRSFDLSKAPLLRVGLLKLHSQKHILMYDLHHIISDGVSMGILVKEMADAYNGQELSELRIQYKDFAAWQNELFISNQIKDQEEYWLTTFSGEIPILNLPTDFVRPSEKSFEGDRLSFRVGKELTERLKQTAKETGSTLYMVLLSAFNILLSKYSGQDDIVVGSPLAGRPHADLEMIIGMFVNTLAMRNYPVYEKTIEEFLKEVKENAIAAYENQEYQFEELVDHLQISRDLSRNPLFDVMFVMQNMEREEMQVSNLIFTPFQYSDSIAKFDLAIIASEIDQEIIFHLDYWIKLFKRETIEKMSIHLINILVAMGENITVKLSEIEMLTEEEKVKLLYDFNKTKADYPVDQTVHEVFEAQVEKVSEEIAAEYEGQKITYRELNEKANQLARTLREKGVGTGSIVGLVADRSLDMLVGIMAILKSGGAYLPINSNYPEERINFMLEDSGAEIVLTHKYLHDQIPFTGPILSLEDQATYKQDRTNLDLVYDARTLAYVIYTSGSTGKPKGVMIPHQALNNYLFSIYHSYDEKLGQGDRCLSMANISFDASIVEFFLPLTFGATVVLFNNDLIPDMYKLARTVIDQSLTFILIPASLLKQVYEVLSQENGQVKLNKILVGLEPIKDSILADYMNLNENMQILNGYGPTETTICSTFYKYQYTLPVDKNIPIGKPINNTRIYILDSKEKLVPLGVVGELCIAGDGLADGYINRPDLTADKFIDNPFEPGERMYKTGDLAKWLPDGNLEFLGRIDHQVKVRGYRIELGEIENRLLNHQNVQEAVVTVREDQSGHKDLCAYFIVNQENMNESELTVAELREYVLKELPDYMVPSFFIQLAQLPLTSNGKIDRKSLPAPDGSLVTGVEYEAPRNEIEARLVDIWKEVLGVEKIGINDNFFDLGGHSLKATSLSTKIHKVFHVEVSLKEIFKIPTIKGQSVYLQNTEKTLYAEIQPIEEKEYYEVSSAQKRIYAIQQFDKLSTSYNMPGVLEVDGELDRKRLEEAFDLLIQRHESLRTSFDLLGEEPVQKIHKEVQFAIEYKRITEEETQEGVEKAIQAFVRAFDLSKAPLLRVGLLQIQPNKHILLYDLHHIISDGVSMGILVGEFVETYNGQRLPEFRIHYKDYAAWQNELIRSDQIQSQEEYWIKTFAGEIPVLNLPTDSPRPVVKSFEGDRIHFELGRELTEKLKEVAQETGSSLYMVLLAAYYILLSKYSGQEDIVIGSPIAGRPHADLEKMIGMFVNTLAMRNYPVGDKTIAEFLKEVKENALLAFENQNYQFEELVEKLELPRNLSRNPLFDVMFVMQNMNQGELLIKDLTITPYHLENRVAKFDLTITANQILSSDADEDIALVFEYCSSLFTRESIKKMSSHFRKILEIITTSTEIKLNDINLLTVEAQDKLIKKYNNTKIDYPTDQTICELFTEQVAKTPNQTAVIMNELQMTYLELEEKASKLATSLRHLGVGSDQVVGMFTEPSLEMVIGILGILKAGGAYLPIDPQYPLERIEYILRDANVEILLSQEHLKERIITTSQKRRIDQSIASDRINTTNQSQRKQLEFSGQIIFIDEPIDTDINNVSVVNQPKDLAYIIYTSGSTGTPKGVLVEHQSIMNTIYWRKNEYQMTTGDTVLQLFSYSFDGFLTSFFTPLVSGAKVVLLNEEDAKDPFAIKNVIISKGITHFICVPSLYSVILETLTSKDTTDLKVITLAGEQVKTQLVQQSKELKNDLELVNEYGPTENSVVTTIQRDLQSGQPITIGKPIANIQTFILDRNLNLVPEGVLGELCVSGRGLARGYLNQPELTAEKFVENPFIPGERMYRTGDLARWLPDGQIEFLGRLDHQVKIRGFRIELGEIESQLLYFPAIKQASVIDGKDSTGNSYLVAYFVAEDEVSISEIRRYMSKQLPNYMVPAYFIQIDEMPLTANGKVNRNLLPKLDHALDIQREYIKPRNIVEEKLAEIWSELLGIEKVGIEDDFFELGGHSLKAAILISKIHKVFNVEIPLSKLFENPTIKELAHYTVNSDQKLYVSIPPAEEKEYYPVSSAQKRLFILCQFGGAGISYNMPGALFMTGTLDRERFENAFKQLVTRHETLRTSFDTLNGEVVQKIHKTTDLDVIYTEVKEEALVETMQGFVRSFDLKKAPLLRVGLFRLAEKKYLLLYDMHHIISDGVSMNILMKEFVTLYQGSTLPQLSIQYKDFSVWQNKLFENGIIDEQKKYWLDTFAGPETSEIPVLNMPTDYSRPLVKSFEGSSVSLKLDEELTRKLNSLSKGNGVTLYMTLLASYNVLLSKYTRQEDIVVGSPIAGRDHADLEGLLGVFVNTLAMRNYPQSRKSFKEFLQEVKANALKAYENQDYQFEQLVDILDLPRDMSRNPLFDTMFILQNIDAEVLELDGLTLKPYEWETNVAKFDLTLTAEEKNGRIAFNMGYSTKLFKRKTIEQLMRHFLQILQQVVDNVEMPIADIDMLVPEEKQRILVDFNSTKADYPKGLTLHEMFEKQVADTPDQIAVIFEDQHLTFRELNAKANQLAVVLRQMGAKPDKIVAVMIERSLEMMIGIMGILKAGGGYLPISPSYPEDRVTYMLDDSNAEILLTNKEWVAKIENFSGEVLDLEDHTFYSGDEVNLSQVNKPQDIAYVIYTSGSTGKPKGVMIEHSSALNRINWMQKKYPIGIGDTILQKTPFTFDVSVWEIFWWTFVGAKLCLLSPGGEKDPVMIVDAIEKYQVTTMHFVPSMLSAFLQCVGDMGSHCRLLSLRQVFASGEALALPQVEKFNSLLYETNGTTLHNLYGPTEATVDVSYFDCSSENEQDMIPIGKPIDNTQLYVVDQNKHLCPVGVPGELCISGVGLARGYLNKLELTVEKFVANPFILGERMYCTGDLARWLPDGNIEFLGRLDHQVKIRGFRIELGEIENKLISYPSVKEAVVITKEDQSGNKDLCAYIVVDQQSMANEDLTITELRKHLSKELPDYMIPAYFIQLDQIPLTSNGKINRKALPEPDGSMTSGVEYEAPKTELEKQIAGIWEEILNVDRIGLYDHFFEVGGNSLKIIQLNQRLSEELKIELSVTDLFKYTNIHKLANHINHILHHSFNQVAAAEETIDNRQQLDEGKKRLQKRMQRRMQKRKGE